MIQLSTKKTKIKISIPITINQFNFLSLYVPFEENKQTHIHTQKHDDMLSCCATKKEKKIPSDWTQFAKNISFGEWSPD